MITVGYVRRKRSSLATYRERLKAEALVTQFQENDREYLRIRKVVETWKVGSASWLVNHRELEY